MPDRLDVTKTYKLYIDGKFPRSESGRTVAVHDSKGKVLAHLSKASRKDLRDAVGAARKAQPGWRDATAYLRGQILYRMAEMMEGKRDEFAGAIRAGGASNAGAEREVTAAIDRLVAFAGWADKFAQVLGCNNAVAGPYYNFTVPEPTGVVVAFGPDEPGLLGLISLIAPAACSGNAVVALAGEGTAAAVSAVVLGEVMATSDVPPGVVNILTGERAELVPVVANHRDVDAVVAFAGPGGLSDDLRRVLREGAAENVKRVTVKDLGKVKGRGEGIDLFDPQQCESPWWIEPTVEMKTIWHPSAV